MTMTGFEAQWQNLPGCACVPRLNNTRPARTRGGVRSPHPVGTHRQERGGRGALRGLLGKAGLALVSCAPWWPGGGCVALVFRRPRGGLGGAALQVCRLSLRGKADFRGTPWG